MKPIIGGRAPDGGGEAPETGLFTNRRLGAHLGDGPLGAFLQGPVGKGVLLGFLGLVVGYVFATVALFPAAARSSDLQPVPDLLGQGYLAAEDVVRELGLIVGRVDTIHHPEAVFGAILGQNPLPGQLIPTGGEIHLRISGGPVELPVPAVVGRQLSQARDLLLAAGFTLVADTVESSAPAGEVVEADPAPGERVALPMTVRVAVSEGPPMVTVPRLIGLDEDRAVQILDSLGLEVTEVAERFRFGLDQGRVIEQEPAAGVSVEHGSGVRLVVGRRGGAGP